MLRENFAMRKKKAGMTSLIIISLIISGIFLVAPGVQQADAQILGGEYGGNLRVAIKAVPTSLNPLNANLNEAAEEIIDLLYEPLYRTNPYDYGLDPWLAVGDPVVDPMNESVITVTIRDDVKWHHDGTVVDVQDVEYTFGPGGYDIDYIFDMTIDAASRQITFLLDTPNAKFFSEVLLMKIVPDGYLSTSTADNGCGPFKLSSTDTSSTVILANEDYFKGRPYLDSVKYTYYPYNVSQPTDDMKEGIYRAAIDIINDELDFISWGLTSNETNMLVEIPPSSGNTTTLVLNENVSVVRNDGLDFWYLGMNCDPNHILNDSAVRRALAHCINKVNLVRYDTGGGLTKSESNVHKYVIPWYNSSINIYEYDEIKAEQILNEAGYMDYNSDGYRETPDGQPFSFVLLSPPQEDITPAQMALDIMTWVESVGINVTLVPGTAEDHQTTIESDLYDMYLATETRPTLDPYYLNYLFHSEEITNDNNLLNFQGIVEMVNETLTEKLNETTLTAQLNSTVLVGGQVVWMNDTQIPSSDFTLDAASGLFTLNRAFNFTTDKLNITYYYKKLDHLMDMSNIQMDHTIRADYIKEAQGYLSSVMPNVPLFSFKVNHAYNASGYVGWVNTLDGINNFWSFLEVRNPLMEGNLEVKLSALPQAYVDENEELTLQVRVEDIDGIALSNVDLAFTGEGTFETPVWDSGSGVYNTLFIAPDTEISRTISIGVTAAKVSYGGNTDQVNITIHPAENEFEITVTKGENKMPSGNETYVVFTVLDEDTDAPVVGATVTIAISPTGLGGRLSTYNSTTDANGIVNVTFGTENVTIDTTFKITASFSMDGYDTEEKFTSISVTRGDFEPPSTGFLGLPAPPILVVLLLFASMALLYNRRKKR